MNEVKVFIVEDNPAFLKVLSNYIDEVKLLKLVGTANNGEDALELIKEVKPDLVLMDISMPGMDGIKTTYRVKKTDGCTPKVIMISFYDTPYYRQIAKAVKAEEFIGKSDLIDKLVPLIKKLYPELRKGSRSKSDSNNSRSQYN
jgi:YesN/AraC family two-component response regulator